MAIPNNTQTDPNPVPTPDGGNGGDPNVPTNDTDKGNPTNLTMEELAGRLKALETQNDDYKKQLAGRDRRVHELTESLNSLKTEKLTDEERTALEKAEFERQKVDFAREKMLNYVSDKLTAEGYLTGLSVEEIANLKTMVLADTTEEADRRIQALSSTLGKITHNRYTGAGRPAPSSKPAAPAWNPFASEQLNVTEQHKLWKENPDKAKQLQEAAKRRA